MYGLFKFFAFKMDPERAHHLALYMAARFPHVLAWALGGENIGNQSKYALNVGGVNWPFPIGLAAGLDKNAQAVPFFSHLSFGAVEVGTVTPRPQQGNTRPRLFRYNKIRSLRNCMGFNNEGMGKVGHNIQRVQKIVPLGVNLGKNKDTSDDKAFLDYQVLYKYFSPLADYLVINVSSPNTPGLKQHQGKEKLKCILDALQSSRKAHFCPLFLKISPLMQEKFLADIVEVANHYRLAGIIATNTAEMEEYGPGGMSGEVLRSQAQWTRKQLLFLTKKTNLEVIGVGGISSFEDVLEFWKAGGKVVQVYTSFIYQGPHLLKKVRKGIDRFIQEQGVQTLKEALHLLETK